MPPGNIGRAGASLIFHELHLEDEHPLRASRLALVRKLLGDPDAALLAFDHEL